MAIHLNSQIIHVHYSQYTGFIFFFFNDTATTEIYTLSLHDALPICQVLHGRIVKPNINMSMVVFAILMVVLTTSLIMARSEEHTSELQSHSDVVCRLLLAIKNAFLAKLLFDMLQTTGQISPSYITLY